MMFTNGKAVDGRVFAAVLVIAFLPMATLGIYGLLHLTDTFGQFVRRQADESSE